MIDTMEMQPGRRLAVIEIEAILAVAERAYPWEFQLQDARARDALDSGLAKLRAILASRKGQPQ